jgi:KaiC/GvpD/RAD55 family RecA-like ATPase
MLVDLSKKELEYKWLEAADLIQKALNASEDPGYSIPEAWKKVAFYCNMASRQARDIEEFKRLRQHAVETYEKAAALFEKEGEPESKGKRSECQARAELARSWLASSSAEKQEILVKCDKNARKAREIFNNIGDKVNYSKSCNILSQCLFDRVYLSTTEAEKKNFVLQAIEISDDVISISEKLDSSEDVLLALSLASLNSWYYANIGETESLRKEYSRKSLENSKKAIDLSKKVRSLHSKEMALWARSLAIWCFTERIESSLQYAKEMWEQASLIRDNYFKGIASYLLAVITDLMVPAEANPNKKKQLYEDIIRYSENSIKNLSMVGQDGAIAEVYLVYPQSYSYLSREFALNPTEKLAFSKKAVRIGEKGLEHALRSGSSDAIASNLHALSKAYNYYSNLEPRMHEKPKLLKISLGYRKEYVRMVQEAFESNLWVLGLGLVYAGETESDLAKLEKSEGKKAVLLQDAISDMKRGIPLCEQWVESIGTSSQPTLVAIVAGFQDSFGSILKDNYLLTGDRQNLTQSNEVFDGAAENFRKVDLPSRVAESYWKIASNFDTIGNYEKASGNFEKAFAGYKVAARKIEQFGDFYIDFSNYMKAWSEIENAKLSHTNGKYETARQHYERASSLLGQSKLWNYLSLNFYAWAILEQAEDLSKKEKSKEAIKSFEIAVKFIRESKKALETKLKEIDKRDEENLVRNLVKASEAREAYSYGRIAIEEARTLDKKGNHLISSEKYGEAAKIFEKLAVKYSEQIGRETKPLVFLCQAWEKMTLAESRNSPIMYEEAAELFEKANEYATNESASLLALAHSSFCRALEAGTEFEITRNMEIYEETKKHLDVASEYYLKAGFDAFAEYAKATQHLFEAYVLMEKAKRETDLGKEAKFFQLAEKILQVSVDSYVKAKYQEKTEQVQHLLQKVKEEREVAVSLSEVFHAPNVTSATGSFTTLSPTQEIAVGLERFEHADIQSKVVLDRNEINVGEDAELRIQIVNVGKEPVLLARIENILPESFQLIKSPMGFSFENLRLKILGKQLVPLKTDEIILTLRSLKSGVFEIRPKIVCVDETGQQIVFKTEPATYTVSDAVLPDRISTGYKDLDNLLLGGLPEEYAVVLTSPSNDERELMIRKFLETGVEKDELIFYITTEVGGIAKLAEEFQSSFYLFVCNPRADVMIKNLPNVYKLKGVENLTDIDISLIKAFRSVSSTKTGARRAIVEIISDVLLQHRALITRKWLSGLLPDLRSKGFTILAVINPQMHPTEEVHAILGLFDGEIRVSEKETQTGLQKVLRIRRLYNRRYVEKELIVTRQRLES